VEPEGLDELVDHVEGKCPNLSLIGIFSLILKIGGDVLLDG